MMKTKVCTKCGEDLPINDFYTKQGGEKIRSECKVCTKIKVKEYKERFPHFIDELKYNITEEDYNKIIESQKGKCAICGTHQKDLDKRLHIDHNHTTGKVRGLLCYKCNIGIGFLNDDPELTLKATEYLTQLKL